MTDLILKLTADPEHVLNGVFIEDGRNVFPIFDFITIAYPRGERRDKLVKTDNQRTAYARKWYTDNLKNENSPYYMEFVDKIVMASPGNSCQLTCYTLDTESLKIVCITFIQFYEVRQ